MLFPSTSGLDADPRVITIFAKARESQSVRDRRKFNPDKDVDLRRAGLDLTDAFAMVFRNIKMTFPRRSELVATHAAEEKFNFTIIDDMTADDIRYKVAREYTTPDFSNWKQYRVTWLWSGLKPDTYVSLYNVNPYREIDEFLNGRSYILFFNYKQDKTMFSLPKGTPIAPLISPDELDEFYVSDEHATFLLAYNHEQVLLGCGHAFDWMTSFYFAESELINVVDTP